MIDDAALLSGTRARPTALAGDAWRPPSSTLRLEGRLWESVARRTVSYPADGNDACLAVEDTSYWFAHRNDCLVALLDLFPPGGAVYDIGGGNGFVALALQQAGHETVLLEPGTGAHHALRRGVRHVVHSSLEDAGLEPGSLDAAGAFDVVEHVEDDDAFIASVHRALRPGGRFYCTVPALQWLWSAEDARAGHFRRYTPAGLAALLRRNGFDVEFMTPIFGWLVAPVFMRRALPYRLGLSRSAPLANAMQADHSLPGPLRKAVARWHARELDRLARRVPLRWGSSLLCAARRARADRDSAPGTAGP